MRPLLSGLLAPTLVLTSTLIAPAQVIVSETTLVPSPVPTIATPSVAMSIVEPNASDERVTATDPESRKLQRIAVRVIEGLDAERIPQPEAAKEKLADAIRGVENYIGPGTNGQRWASFLRLDEIKEQLATDRPDVSLLQELATDLKQNYAGLENPSITKLRDAVSHYRAAQQFGANAEAFIKYLERQLGELIELLNEPRQGSGLARADKIGLIINFLHDSNQPPWMIAELRSSFYVPNFQVYAKESLLNRFLTQAVAEPSPVNECILGTRVVGQACLNGSLSADLLPMQNGLALNLNMSASLTSSNRGYNRGVVLRTTSSSPVFATKHLTVSQYGIASSPASVATNFTSRINAIQHRRRIVRRIAQRKAAEQKPQADAIAEGRMQRKLQVQYDDQVEERLRDANVQFASAKSQVQSRPEFKRLDIPKPTLAVYSTDQTVHANAVQAASYQLAADRPCRLPRPTSSQILVELHQSLLINGLESLLAGRTIEHHDIDDLAKQILGKVPPEVLEATKGEPFKVTFAPFNPVQVEFVDNTVAVTLRFSRLEGAETVERGASVKFAYEPTYRRGGVLILKRVGEIEVEVRGRMSDFNRVKLNGAIRAKLKEALDEEIQPDRIDLSSRFPRASSLDIDWLKIDDGWMQIGVR